MDQKTNNVNYVKSPQINRFNVIPIKITAGF